MAMAMATAIKEGVPRCSARRARGGSRHLTWAVGMSTALLAPPVWAQLGLNPGLIPSPGWLISPALSVSEIYTDNVQLAPAGSQRTEWVTTVSPSVTVAATGARLRLNVNYAPQILYRLNEGSKDAAFHNLTATGNSELVRQLLFVDASANTYQTNTSILGTQAPGPQAVSNIYQTGNRTTASAFNISPYLRHKFGSDAEGVARLTYSAVSFSAVEGSTVAPPANTHQTGVSLGLASGPAYKLYTWNVGYSRRTLSSSSPGQQETTTESIRANGTRLLTYQLALVTAMGYTKSNYQTINAANNQGKFTSYGLRWSPTPRTSLQGTLGQSYYGNNRGLDFSHRSGLTVWSANYSESISTTHSQYASPVTVSTADFLSPLSQFSSISDPGARDQAIKDYIAKNSLPPSLVVSRNLSTDQTYLTRALRASAGFIGVRNTVLASAYRSRNENQSTVTTAASAGDFAQSASNTLTGVNLSWNTRLSPRANARMSLSYTRNEFPGNGVTVVDRVDRTKYAEVAVVRDFAKSSSGTLYYHKAQTDSSQTGASYSENAFGARLIVRF